MPKNRDVPGWLPGLTPALRAGILKRLLQILTTQFLMGCVLFGCAGSLKWPLAWLYFGLQAVAIAINAIVLLPRNPDLIAERARLRPEAKSWDKVLAPMVALVGPLAVLVVAGLDQRFGGSGSPTVGQLVAAVAATTAGYGWISWAMASNRFFSGLVAIQSDRAHTVVTHGPYRHLRHPGYLGMIILQPAAAILLESTWALLPAGVTIVATVVRVGLEDRTLHQELEGYSEYAKKVRYRLLPGLW